MAKKVIFVLLMVLVNKVIFFSVRRQITFSDEIKKFKVILLIFVYYYVYLFRLFRLLIRIRFLFSPDVV